MYINYLRNIWINQFFLWSPRAHGCIFSAVNFLRFGVVSHQHVISYHSGKPDSSGKRSALKCQSVHFLKASIKIIFKSIVKRRKLISLPAAKNSMRHLQQFQQIDRYLKNTRGSFYFRTSTNCKDLNYLCNRTVKNTRLLYTDLYRK